MVEGANHAALLVHEKLAVVAITQVAKVEPSAADAVDEVEALRVRELVPQPVVRAAVEPENKAVLLRKDQFARRELLDGEPDLVRQVRQTARRRCTRLDRQFTLAATGEDQVDEEVRALHERPSARNDEERELVNGRGVHETSLQSCAGRSGDGGESGSGRRRASLHR